MTIRFTKQETDNTIQLTRDCTIQNWDPKKDKDKTIFNFKAYCNNTLKNIGTVQEKLLWALAGGHDCCTCEDPDNIVTLTELDLKEAHDRYFNKKDKNLFGDISVTSFQYDEYYGIANLTTSKGDILRIDLLTDAEKQNGENSSKGIFKSNKQTKTINHNSEKKVVSEKKNNIATKEQKSQKVTSVTKNNKKDVEAFLIALGNRESSGDYKVKNRYGYVGLYQVGEEALHDVGVYYETKKTGINYKKNDWIGYISDKNPYGITSLWDFMHSPSKQKAVQIDFKKLHWQYLKNLSLTKYVGKTINGIRITQSGLLAGAHLVGPGGVKDFLQSNGKIDVKDKNGTPVSSYIKKFAGYNIEEITMS